MIWNARYLIEPILTLNMVVMICFYVYESALIQADMWYDDTHNETFVRWCLKNKQNITCKKISNATSDSVSQFHTYISIESGVIGIFTNLFIGYISDVVSRTFVIKLSVVASLCIVGLHVYNSLVMSMPMYWFYIGYFVSSLGAAWGGFISTSFALISDVSDNESRTTRIAVADAGLQLGSIIASYMAGMLISYSTWWSVPLLCCLLLVLQLLYVIIVIRNPPRPKRSYDRNPLQALKSMVDVYTTPTRNRSRIFILSAAYLLHFTAFLSCAGFLVNYLLMPPFDWKTDSIGLVNSMSGLANFVMVLTIPLLRRCRMTETTIAILSCVFCMIGFIVLIVARSFTAVVIALLLKGGSGIAIAIYRSRLSKLVKPTQFGQLFSLLNSVESFASLVSTVALYQIYIVTRNWFNGFNFIVLLILECGALFCTMLDGVWEKRLKRQAESEDESEADDEPLPISSDDKDILVPSTVGDSN